MSSAEQWYQQGLQYYQQGQFPEALHCFEQILHLDPNLAHAWNGKGNALNELGRYLDALEAFEQALHLDPNLAYAWNGKGNSLYRLGQYFEALEAVEKAINLNPNLAGIWNGKGIVLYRLGRYSDALEAFEKAIHLDPKYAYAWNGLGNTLNALQRYSDALEACEKAIYLDPNDAYAWNGKGNALNSLECYSEALEACTKAIFFAPLHLIVWQQFIHSVKRTDVLINFPEHPELEETLQYLIDYLRCESLSQATLETWMKKTVLKKAWHPLEIQLLLLVAQQFPKNFPKAVLLQFFQQLSLRDLQLLCSRFSLSLFSLCQLHLPDQSTLIFLLQLYENIPASHLQLSHFLMFNLFYEEEDLSQCMQRLHPMDQYDYNGYRAILEEEEMAWWELLISEGELQELTFSPSIRGRVIEKVRQYFLQQIYAPEVKDPFDSPGFLLKTIIENIEKIPANWMEPLSLLWTQLTMETLFVAFPEDKGRQEQIDYIEEEQGYWQDSYQDMREAWQETRESLSVHFDADPSFWKWCQTIEIQYAALVSGSAEELFELLEARLYPNPEEKEVWKTPLLV